MDTLSAEYPSVATPVICREGDDLDRRIDQYKKLVSKRLYDEAAVILKKTLVDLPQHDAIELVAKFF